MGLPLPRQVTVSIIHTVSLPYNPKNKKQSLLPYEFDCTTGQLKGKTQCREFFLSQIEQDNLSNNFYFDELVKYGYIEKPKDENNTYYYKFLPLTPNGDREILELSEDELIRLTGCLSKCDKIKMNNWARYCSLNCPYYFNTDNLKKIFIGGV